MAPQQQPDVSPHWFYYHVIVPVCAILGRGNIKAMPSLLLGTALHESHLVFERQLRGPACGWFQMEPSTHNDLWLNCIPRNPVLANGLYELSYNQKPDPNLMVVNQFYAAGMAVAFYQRVPEPLPVWDNPTAQAYYWKQHWNTRLGKGTTEEYLHNWNTYGGAAAIGA